MTSLEFLLIMILLWLSGIVTIAGFISYKMDEHGKHEKKEEKEA